MKVLTAAEMQHVDRLTIAGGIPEDQLVANAARAVFRLIREKFSPLRRQRVLVLCGKGNNGADGRKIAELLSREDPPEKLWVVESASGDPVTPEMRQATIVVDALLGTGLQGKPRGRAAELIEELRGGFPLAKVVAVDLPSGMNSDSGRSETDPPRADYTVTFTAPKIAHVLAPNSDLLGEWRVADIGSPPELYADVQLNLTVPGLFRSLLGPRKPDSNKGSYGHVLVVGGVPGKTGAPQMTGWAALRIGAGLVTIASAARELHILELMTEPLPETFEELQRGAERKNVIAIGPGLGSDPKHAQLVRQAVKACEQLLVLDADGLNAIAGADWRGGDALRVLTPHPGEMARLTGKTVAEVQAARLAIARGFAAEKNSVVVLKGRQTVVAAPDGNAWINPVDTPALAKGGTGDILTGLISGMLAQFPTEPLKAVVAAVYLHGRSGQLAAEKRGEMCVLATDLLDHLGEAIGECARIPD